MASWTRQKLLVVRRGLRIYVEEFLDTFVAYEFDEDYATEVVRDSQTWCAYRQDIP
jgi:hypothetical protein